MIRISVHHADDAGNIITLDEPLTVKWNGREITVPAGFRCDGCSVPRFLWDSLSPRLDPETLRAAIVHDYIYRGNCPGWNRKDADKMFCELVQADGVSGCRAKISYWGLRLFGSGSWQGGE